ncbi:MAG: hypothetical protein DSZ29_02825 [Aquificaceae bacterium]|nr:MAG: hypothetical protein DSZ29_02825 [Aquificaceae bacterium]
MKGRLLMHLNIKYDEKSTHLKQLDEESVSQKQNHITIANAIYENIPPSLSLYGARYRACS